MTTRQINAAVLRFAKLRGLETKTVRNNDDLLAHAKEEWKKGPALEGRRGLMTPVPGSSPGRRPRQINRLTLVELDQPEEALVARSQLNNYVEALGATDSGMSVFDAVPKSVWAAIAVSKSTTGGDYLERAREFVCLEWERLHEAGVVSQKPPKWAKAAAMKGRELEDA